MPASFLNQAAAHHLGATLATFGESTLREGGRYIWFTAEAQVNGTGEDLAFTMPVPCAFGVPRRKAAALFGESFIPSHEIAVHLDAAALPWSPLIPNDTQFLLANAGPGMAPDPADTTQRIYLIKEITEPLPGHTHLRLLAALHNNGT